MLDESGSEVKQVRGWVHLAMAFLERAFQHRDGINLVTAKVGQLEWPVPGTRD